MFNAKPTIPTPGKMEARKEVRMHLADAQRIKVAAAATGLQESDFIRNAILMRLQQVEQHSSLSILPKDAFEGFSRAVDKQGAVVSGLAQAAEDSKGILGNAE